MNLKLFKKTSKNGLFGKDDKNECALGFIYSAPGYQNHAVEIFYSFCPQAPDPELPTYSVAVDQGPSSVKLTQSCLFSLLCQKTIQDHGFWRAVL